MIIANEKQIALYTGQAAYGTGASHNPEAAAINRAVVAKSGGKLPCYASRIGKKGAVKWVSVGSSAVIARSVASDWLSRYGVNIDEVEAAGR
ncbi:hypothetical protein [Rhizobium phage RHph_X2_26]|nr:hypothetical protein [Rhizobium phage RHph_X2_26]